MHAVDISNRKMNYRKTPSSKSVRLVYITTGSRPEAQRIANVLVKERWAACANYFGPITSVYWWQGRRQQAREWILLAKTRAALTAGLVRRVRALHTYVVPCIVVVPIHRGNPEFFRWIVQETDRRAAAHPAKRQKRDHPSSR